VRDRHALWNRVESAELRKDSQLLRTIEVGIPVELAPANSVALLREYIAQEFVSKGMIADFGICRADPHNPHARILLTLREPTARGFGPKARHWNRKSNLIDWRAAWAEVANRHLARAGHALRLDHRSLEAQQSELVPGRKIGVGRQRALLQPALPPHLELRVAERRRIALQNGEMILEDPTVAVRALAHRQATFTQHDIVQFLKSRTADARQLEAALGAILASSELVPLEEDSPRFTSRDLLEAEKSLFKRVAAMTSRRRRSLPGGAPAARAATAPTAQTAPVATAQQHEWTAQERRHFDCLVGGGDLAVLAVAGGSLGPPLVAARLFWEAQGRPVSGIALSRARVEWLQTQAGISSQTLADRDAALQQDRAPLTGDQVLIVDGAEMIGVKHLERLLAAADRARAKLVLLADADHLDALGAHSPMHSIIEQVRAPHP
jgi:ATP-dependent exoDNAse (exonuclease V) alpha subunit